MKIVTKVDKGAVRSHLLAVLEEHPKVRELNYCWTKGDSTLTVTVDNDAVSNYEDPSEFFMDLPLHDFLAMELVEGVVSTVTSNDDQKAEERSVLITYLDIVIASVNQEAITDLADSLAGESCGQTGLSPVRECPSPISQATPRYDHWEITMSGGLISRQKLDELLETFGGLYGGFCDLKRMDFDVVRGES